MTEIVLQTDDILSFFGSAQYLQDTTTEWTLEILRAVIRMAGYLVHPLKYHFDIPRATAFDQRAMPIIQTPTHASWPSGHATEAFAVATVLDGLSDLKADSSQMVKADDHVKEPSLNMRIAARIADNRTIAGVHYPMDSLAGAVLGITTGEVLLNYMSGKAKTPKRDLGIAADLKKRDFNLGELNNVLNGADSKTSTLPSRDVMADKVSEEMLRLARMELT